MNPLERLSISARELHLTLLPHGLREVSNASDFDAELSAIKGEGADALFAFPDFVVSKYYPTIGRFAVANRLPSMFLDARAIEDGGLLSYYTDWLSLRRRAAAYVDKIIKGAAPADLPVEQPTEYALTVNLKTAKAIGLTIPQSILLRADRIIE